MFGRGNFGFAALLVWTLLGLGGCAVRSNGDGESSSPSPEAEEATSSEVPDGLVTQMITDLSEKAGCEPEDVEVVRAKAVTWNDASLGCAEPGQVYMQMLTEGYQVVLRHERDKYDYRSGGSDGFILCERDDRKDPMR